MPGAQSIHGAQASAFCVVLYVPLAQAEHCRSDTALPFDCTRVPAEQFDHGAHLVAALLSLSHVPSGHASFGASPPAQYVPTAQGTQTAGEVCVAGAVSSVPAAHAPLCAQLDWLFVDVYVSGGHVAQSRSVVVLPSTLTYVPGVQFFHAVQCGALSVTLKVPLVHSAHVRSAVALPLVDTDCPARHTVHATHVVDGSPS